MTIPLTPKGQQLLCVLWVEITLSLVFIGLRLYTRTYVGGASGSDDYILVFSWLLMMVFAACISRSVAYGMGAHASAMTLDDRARGIFWLLIGQFFVSIAMGISKCAVTAFLMRIVNKTWHKVLLYFLMAAILLLCFFLAAAILLRCTPFEAILDVRIQGKCTLNLAVIAKVICSFSAALDFFLAGFPWLVIWGLNMKRKEKIAICISLSLGVIAGVCGVLRTMTLDSLNDTDDYLYSVSNSIIWTMSELTATIICVSIPALRPLYNRLTGRSSHGEPYKNYSHGNNKSGHAAGGEYGLKSMNRGKKGPHSDVEGMQGDMDNDDDSDAGILTEGPENGGIRRHHEFTVTFEDGLSATSSKQHV
ncbi:hypothetical protein DSL72_001727 [Monilinia vaccinii-corymbosi]|uniref:Rhodopsin domain-containing protein n=1 Tax=Monilinia vaccinii-corymbosi TaxID=61207 RepID=A0A8A3P7T7_9HELO|nr:hypothetical protein DSL72_001727 [Monilinia vaccinii-corymbosi]